MTDASTAVREDADEIEAVADEKGETAPSQAEEPKKKEAELGKKVLEELPAEVEATFDLLVSKRRRVHTFYVHRQGDDGEESRLKLVFRAISPEAYDKLKEDHAPTAKQQRQFPNLDYNRDTFPPVLIAAVSYKPKLSEEQAREIWTSPNWSTGERDSLLYNAQVVQQAGVDVSFTAPG